MYVYAYLRVCSGSISAARFDEPRQRAMTKLRKLYDHPKVQEALPRIMSKLVAGELPYATATLQELVTIRTGRTVRFAKPQGGSSFSTLLQEQFSASAEAPATTETFREAPPRSPTPPSSSTWSSYKRARNSPSSIERLLDKWVAPGLHVDDQDDMTGPNSSRR